MTTGRFLRLGTWGALILVMTVQPEAVRRQSDGARPQDLGVREAIDIGLRGEPAAYPLFGRREGVKQSPAIVGSVYTPLLRVAMWVHQRRVELSAPPTPADIPDDLLEPTLVIAIHNGPSCCPEVDPGPPVRACVALVPIRDAQAFPCEERVGYPATWTTSDVDFLERFDPTTASRTAALASFPLREVSRELDVVYELHRREMSGAETLHFVGYGTIREKDIVAWR